MLSFHNRGAPVSRRCRDQLAVINMTLDMAHFGSLVDKQGPGNQFG